MVEYWGRLVFTIPPDIIFSWERTFGHQNCGHQIYLNEMKGTQEKMIYIFKIIEWTASSSLDLVVICITLLKHLAREWDSYRHGHSHSSDRTISKEHFFLQEIFGWLYVTLLKTLTRLILSIRFWRYLIWITVPFIEK